MLTQSYQNFYNMKSLINHNQLIKFSCNGANHGRETKYLRRMCITTIKLSALYAKAGVGLVGGFAANPVNTR